MADTGKERRLPVLEDTLRMVAWEVTRRCNLACVHCRASSERGPYPGELTTDEGLRLLDDIAAFSRPVIILTGGEPLLREDVYDLAAYGTKKGLRMVLATNGTLVTETVARRMIEAGIQRVSISIDGADAASHDAFRCVSGAFEGAMAGIEAMRRAGLEFQINTTITRANLAAIGRILDLAVRIGAAAHHIFLLVPTGRGREMADQAISAEEYEETLKWFAGQDRRSPIQLKATCAPHYFRVVRQQKKLKAGDSDSGSAGAGASGPQGHPFHAMTRGCLGGSAFCFISHTGQVQPCGYLEVDCGRVRERGFEAVWKESAVFKDLRDLNRYGGKCGRCEFIRVCGGCRARAYEATGDYLAEEPLCIYEPGGSR
ncbi:MAG: heme b synthase [Syntrophaceae bacterium]|nr:heme b synthase [Syntrophaceae bacterium]